ncbi:kinesin-like protein KIN-14S isoform X7 [Juglans microcarpa x Juglans regia]|uniref:kinesin-like protein KIN-14S isoform X7 n=1 Tax=Juglans microcarpa x Juglans regia TaxID=2249226 RepID=UPI001B7DE6A0|nr:kinesin-like protein KIN-14S isoform X7 [Juglans microcarpa x Juglans regia]
MDDRTVETPSENFKTPLEDSISRSEHTQEIETSQILETETSESGIDKETSPDQGQTLPILKKIIDLSTKVQELKKEYSVLSDQVKLTTDSFPGLEVLNTLGLLSTEYELLKKKYVEESSERKRLYNEVIELKGNIRVFCRCRPLNQTEITNGCAPVVEFDSTQDNELQVVCSDSAKKQFKFDHIFRPEDNQEVVFAQTKPIATSVLDGYNVCIFAYGQTGTGKTFTMEGTPENRGVNYRTLEELFRISEERGGIIRYGLFVSMLEVYNEKIRDLLVENSNQPAKKLEIKQAAEGTQEVPGLVEARVYGTEDVWELLKSGSRVRSVGSTNANELSSRSHCLLRVTIKGENLINGHCTKSHLWLVDLAGSERVGRTEVEGERLKESQFINKSLSALGDVISALASKTAHIPYRNSKLTHILQSSLGGDCKTLMFVQISPDVADLGETLCSLNFASRVRGIESGPARKQVDFNELFKYKQMAEKLKHDEKETKKLQDNLQSLQLRLSAREHICRNLQEKVRDLENQLAEERKTRLKQEARAFSAASVQPSALPSLKQAGQKSITQKKPPLGPSKLRLPLRRITNFLSQPSPIPPKKTSKTTSIIPASGGGKENITTTTMAATNAKGLMKPRRFSVAVRPPPPPLSSTTTATQVLQPRRRVSIATLRPEPSSQMSTPLHTSTSRFKNDSAMGRQSFVRDPRKARYSRLFSPLPESRSRAAETTPTAMRSSSKFMGSPPTQAGSSKLRHTTVVALQRKALVWSPLKLRSLKNNRKPSLLPSRSSTDIQCNPPHITY